jgi:flagellar basal-body rod protein FlgG
MDALDWAGSAMVAARTRLEIATQNLANVTSDGFRKLTARGTLTPFGVRVDAERSAQRGALRRTERDYDLAIVGPGHFSVRDAGGRVVATRDGSFERTVDGTLVDARGRTLLGRGGPLRVPERATIDERGHVVVDGSPTQQSIELANDATLRSGFVETSAVDAIAEMVGIVAASRSYESAQKVVGAIDTIRQKNASDVARVR